MKMKLPSGFLFLLLVWTPLSSAWAGMASGRPLDLYNAAPRDLVVVFEVSPREVPAQIDTIYSREFPATLEPGLRDGEVRVVIAAPLIEEHLLVREHPVPGSFSDFVWTFDVETGHVVSATLTGRVTRRLKWGIGTTLARADIDVEMGTTRVAGFRAPMRLLGQLFFRHCDREKSRNCRIVEAAPFDPATGYVNAVGGMRVSSRVMNLETFSPLGEAIFQEVHPARESRMALEGAAVDDAYLVRRGSARHATAEGLEALHAKELN